MKSVRALLVAVVMMVGAQSAFARVNTCVDANGGVYNPTHSVNGCGENQECENQSQLTCTNDKCVFQTADLSGLMYLGKGAEMTTPDTQAVLNVLKTDGLGGFAGQETLAESHVFVLLSHHGLLFACDAAPLSLTTKSK